MHFLPAPAVPALFIQFEASAHKLAEIILDNESMEAQRTT